jgi:hypothetical protein
MLERDINLDVFVGGEIEYLWERPAWYGTMFENILLKDLGLKSEVDKIKVIVLD